jgi:hypothetical protein
MRLGPEEAQNHPLLDFPLIPVSFFLRPQSHSLKSQSSTPFNGEFPINQISVHGNWSLDC